MNFQVQIIKTGRVMDTRVMTPEEGDIDSAMTTGKFASREAAGRALVENRAEQIAEEEHGPWAWADVRKLEEKT